MAAPHPAPPRVLAALLVICALLAAPSSAAAAGDVGYQGGSYAGVTTAGPTGEKPESKLWWNDGRWWGSLFHPASGGYRIFYLDVATQTWVATDTPLDPRPSSKADVLWHAGANKLYVASHVFASSGSSATTAESSRLYRFSYNGSTKTYTLDAGFPALINQAKSESLVIERDSTGRLWATWVQGKQVYVNRTLCNPGCSDSAWGTPFVPAVNGVHPNSTSVSSDDISSLVAFGNRIGLMWSNQNHSAMYFAIHDDSAGDATWHASRTALQGSGSADDHINLAALLSDGAGRVYAVTKTSHSTSSAPLIMLLVRDPATGNWASHVHSTKQYNQTRPIVLIDESAARLHVFTADTGGGSIYHKSTPLASISFVPGKGTVVIHDDVARNMNNPTSTKQNVNSQTGLVVLASNDSTSRYWHHHDPLAGSPPPPPGPSAPVANFSATPTSGTAPLTVSFSDTSTSSPTSWAWDFDNNGTIDSTAQHPQYTYTAAGTYSVRLTATNSAGSNTITKTNHITVGSASGGSSTSLTFTPIADAKVSQASPTKNYGTTTDLRVRLTSSQTHYSYLKFNVTGVSGSISSAKLRLYVTDPSADGGSVHQVASSWTESGITWSNAPPISGPALGALGPAATGVWLEVDVTAAVAAGAGEYSFGIRNQVSDSVLYSSREGANPPRLVVTTSAGSPPPPPGPSAPVANFSATPTSGTAPLTVSFSDTSTSSPTSWAWDFDNNGTIDSTAQHPQYTYTAAGTYSVRLTATNSAGSNTITKTNHITVGSASGGSSTSLTFTPIADAKVSQASPTKNYGTTTDLRVRLTARQSWNSYLKFNVTGVSGTVTSAVLRLYVTTSSPVGGTVHTVGSDWTETGITWTNAPAPGSTVGSAGAVKQGTWVEIPLSPAVNGNGTWSFALTTTSGNSAVYSSREATNRPQLVITAGG